MELLKCHDPQPNHKATKTHSVSSISRTKLVKQQTTTAALSVETLHQLQADFFSTVSRELQIPLCNMKMAIEVLGLILNHNQSRSAGLPQPEVEDNKAAHCLKILESECERQINLVNDLLDLQRLKAGVYPTFFTEVVSLQDWLLPTLEPLSAQAQQNQQTLEIHLAADLPSLVTEPTSLKRILTELLTNASKHTPTGETIRVEADSNQGMLQLSVSNTGVEIPADELPYIFDEFYCVSHTDSWRQSGVGLGLALVQKLVERLNGSISVESASNTTCFTVELPLVTLQPRE